MEVATLISLIALCCAALRLAYRVGRLQESIEGRLNDHDERFERHENRITYLERRPSDAAHATG